MGTNLTLQIAVATVPGERRRVQWGSFLKENAPQGCGLAR